MRFRAIQSISHISAALVAQPPRLWRYLHAKLGPHSGVKLAGIGAIVLVLGLAVAIFPQLAHATSPVTGAVYTTVDESIDGTGNCLNGNPANNCNIYTGKQYVWLNGGPTAGDIGNGAYFFAVLDPGGQNNPNDGASGNLSSPNDAYTARSFTISGCDKKGQNCALSYSGSHTFDNPQIRLMPYDDTTNPGGVYIMAVCSLDGTLDSAKYGTPGVKPSDCKYDAFKVKPSTPPVAEDLQITKDATGAYTDTYTWDIQKSVDQTQVTHAGNWTFNYTVAVTRDGGTVSAVKVTGTIAVTNPNVDTNNNTVPVQISGVSDQLSDGTVCTVTNGGSQTLSAFNTPFAYECDLASLPTGELDNTATVSWTQQALSNGALAAGSASFTFSDIQFDPSNVDDCTTVTDPNSPTNPLGTTCSSTSYTYSQTVTGSPGTCVTQNNTATLTTNTTSTTGTASQSVQLCDPADLTVIKDANPTFTRTYNWSIQKAVDKTFLDPGGTANYSVTVTETGFTDSAWQVTGTITVSNPNDFESVTLTGVSDALDNGGTCTITSGNPNAVLAPHGQSGDSTQLGYSCTYPSSGPTASNGTNTATANWDQTVALTPDGSATGTRTFAFDTPTTRVNQTVTVTDTYAGTLGTVTASDNVKGLSSQVFTYSRTFTPPSGCQMVNNTATIVQTNQSSSAQVKNCNSGALTMGFWQGPNGQKIINGANQSALGSWLKNYHPFSDAPSTGLATYVSKIIAAANCGGSTCNTMLKAQMLSTALDVYFSDPAFGGNKINAPSPIGALKINLTTPENDSLAFGGNSCMLISDMLSYQNTSPADPAADAGANWYGQVKATQVLAKDAFDNINNQKVVGC